MGGEKDRRGLERKGSCFYFSEWILQLSSGECAGIPQSVLLKNAVIPNRSAAEHTHTNNMSFLNHIY